MANNRMYLVCRGCNEKLFMGKTMCSGYYTDFTDRSNLNDFYDEHSFCGEVDHENQFELQYEIANSEKVKEYNPNFAKI